MSGIFGMHEVNDKWKVYHVGDIGVDETTILKRILEKTMWSCDLFFQGSMVDSHKQGTDADNFWQVVI